MSGIFGIADRGHHISAGPLAKTMAENMTHLEWFVAEHFEDYEHNLALGRIGIGIFNKSPQPIWNANHSIALVMSGEFYNQDTLKGNNQAVSDEQFALNLYEELGGDFVAQLDGAFIIAIWDKNRKCILIVNDRFGLYPLYYAHYNNKFTFSPEMKGILCDSEFKKELDLTALAEYMRFQFLLGNKTFFQGIKILPSASILHYDLQTDRLSIQPYWDYSKIPSLPASLTFDDAVEEASRLLEAAVRKLTRDDYRFGVYLSGGMDSRLILGLIKRELFPVTTITYGQRDCRDVAYAQKIASKAGANHYYFGFSDGKWVEKYANFHLELTEGFHSWIHAHGISIMGQIRSLIDVNLTGLGGAEINWEDPALLYATDNISFTSKVFKSLCFETTWPSIDEAEEKYLYSSKTLTKVRGLAFDSFRSELAKYNYLPFKLQAVHFSRQSDRRLFQYFTVFHKSHFEQRFPFYDYDYIDFVHALPPEMLFKRKLRRAVINKMTRSLARIPYDKDDLPITNSKMSLLLAKLTKKSKSIVNSYIAPVFPKYAPLNADYDSWLRTDLRDWGEKLLLGERTLQRDIFNPAFLDSLWHRHQSGLEIHTIGKIAPIMTYEMMLRRFYDGDEVPSLIQT